MSQPLPFPSIPLLSNRARAIPEKNILVPISLIARSPAFQQELVKNVNRDSIAFIRENFTGLNKKYLLVALQETRQLIERSRCRIQV
jgi:hypothetical protein